MDISKLDVVTLSNEGYPCVIKNPKTGEATDIVITIKGVYAGGQIKQMGANFIPSICGKMIYPLPRRLSRRRGLMLTAFVKFDEMLLS